MANSKYSDTAVNAEANALAALANAGSLVIYDGPQPANANTAVAGSNHALVSHALPNPAFGAAVAGLLTANAIAAAVITIAGISNWFRILKTDGVTVICDGNVGNQTVTLSAQALVAATTLSVQALSLPLFSGQDLWFNDGTTTLKKASASANVAAGATSVPVTALGATIANGSTSVQNMTVNSPSYQVNAQSSVSSLTIQVQESGT